MTLRVRFAIQPNILRALIAACALTFATAFSSVSLAQPTPPPVFRTVDDNGVDVARGAFNLTLDGVSIGQPNAGGLAFARTWLGATLGWRHNYEGWIVGTGPGTIAVSLGPATTTFTYDVGTSAFVSDQRNGAMLVYDGGAGTYTFTTATGAVAVFSAASNRVTQLTQPNQEVLTFHYVTATISSVTYWRLQSVTNTLGYQLHFEYALNNPTTGGELSAWQTLTKVTAINNAIDYCNPTANACTGMSETWATTTFATSGVYETITDSLGQATRLTYDSGYISAIRRPTSNSTDHITITYSSGMVAGVSYWRDALNADTWSYGYVDAGDHRTTTVTDPLSHQTVYTANNTNGILASARDALNNLTNFYYDAYGRQTSVVLPEDNYTQYTYDGRGNVTETRIVAKPGSGLSDMVSTASFPGSCSNPVICNQPDSVTDPRGYRTDFTYDATHGGVLTVTAPAPSGSTPVGSGTRPQTRYAYTAFYAYYKNSGGSIVAAPSAVYRLVEISACATGASCDGTSDETVTTLTYGSNGVANNRLPLSSTIAAGNAAVSATTGMSYDHVGNLIDVDGPLSGTADTTRMRYDAVRQVIGVIGPDPDSGGSLKHRAVRTIYNADGQPTAIEQGTVNSQSDPDWANFAVLERRETTYDFVGRPIRNSFIAQSQTHAVAQMTYDNANRLDCVAQRMNPAVYGSLPSSACSLGTEGAHGPDRITRYTYNNANQRTKITQAYATGAAIDYWTATYTDNGLVATLADAGGNLSTYVYDGLDRVYRLRYPNPSSSGSSATDYEQYSYDAASNVTAWRRRSNDTIDFSYDNLNRVTTTDAPGGSSLDVTATYDLLGRQLTQATSGQTLTFGYDQLSRLTSAQSTLGTVSYQYDAASRRTRITWPDSFYAQYDYDLTNAVTAIRENGAGSGPGVLAVFAYDNLGRRTSLTRGNGTATSYAYDSASRLEDLVNDLASTTYDQTLEFTYNAAGQSVTRDNSNASFEWTPPSPGTVNYTDNNLNQYASVGGTGFSYDTRGNLTGNGARTFGYDVFNRLTSVSGAGATTLAYDPAGRLYQTDASSVTTRFLYDGVTAIAEYDGSSALVRRYVPGPAIDEPITWYEGSGTTDRRWLIGDQLGSITAVTDGSGAATSVNTYGEYGQPNAWTGSRFRYTGQMILPEAQLYHYRARAYDPALGRFLQTDPILFDGGMNLYAYVRNDPVNLVDPWGLRDDEGFTVTGTRPQCEGDYCVWGGQIADVVNSMQVWAPIPSVGETVVTSRCEDSPECMALRNARERGNDNFRSAIPGGGAILCVLDGCRMIDWAGAGFEFVPWGRLGGMLGKVCGCFEEGTLVATPEGLRRIEEIEVGDYVLAWDEATGEVSPQRVTALIRPQPKVLWRLDTRNAGGETATFHVTDDHPWYVEGQGWVETQHLQAGQRIETADDRGILILGIARTDRVERTYNLTVEGLHTYLVGEDGAVVHNCLTSIWQSAQRLWGNGLTAVGRAFQKHASRGGRFAAPTAGGAGSLNARGLNAAEEILTHPGSTTRANRYGGVDIIAPDGRGVRTDATGAFIGFIE